MTARALKAVRPLPGAPEQTKASTVLDRLRLDIVNGRFAPGEKLRLEHLAPRFGVGRTPLREACFRLTAEGLVTSEDQRGFRVAAISRAELLDLTRCRQQLETLALRASIQRGGPAWEVEVSAALLGLKRAGAPGRKGALDDAWEREHTRLHRALRSACGSPALMRICDSLSDQTERYRRLAAAYGQPSRDIPNEHAAIVRAALDRDEERACALVVEHIARTTERVLAGHPALQVILSTK
jgi:GntR family transcriptional regulator, carbon starvation induced regulator